LFNRWALNPMGITRAGLLPVTQPSCTFPFNKMFIKK
jgi:hypothetical protein